MKSPRLHQAVRNRIRQKRGKIAKIKFAISEVAIGTSIKLNMLGATPAMIPKKNENMNSSFAPLRSGEKSNITFPMNEQIAAKILIPMITFKKEAVLSCNPPAITPQINTIITKHNTNKSNPAPMRQRYN